MAADGQKLSKQNGAIALDVGDPVAALNAAAEKLDLHKPTARETAPWLESAVAAWRERHAA